MSSSSGIIDEVMTIGESKLQYYLLLNLQQYKSHTFSIWKKKYSIQDSLSCHTHLWEKKISVQDVLIMSYPFPKMVVSIQESPRHLSKISRTFQDISFQVTYHDLKFPGHLYFSKISVQDALIMSYPYIGHWGVLTISKVTNLTLRMLWHTYLWCS